MNSFSDLAIPEPIKKALDKLQFNTPTDIQKGAIPTGLDGKDIIACASTGSGKTAAFGIPALTMVLNNPDKNALILAPTRELAQQISEFMRELTFYSENITMVSLVGGFDMSRQLNALRRRPRIIIATPGRLTDHLRRRTVNLSNVGILILDEGDRMLDMGFAPQLDVILQFLPQKRQTMLFTATLPPKVKSLASKYLHKPQEIMVGNTSQPVDSVAQSAIVVPQDQKNDKLLEELNARSGSVIVFARTQRRTDALTYFLEDSGIDAVAIHGGLTQGKRTRAIQGFKHGDFRVLVATDIAARGIDVPSVEHVVNFDLPLMDEDYVHRIGRTGRNGAKGEAVSFVSHQEFGLWSMIARKYNVKSDIADPRRSGKKKFGGRTRDRDRSFSSDGGERSFRPRKDFGAKREFGGGRDFNENSDFKRGKDNSFYTAKEFTPAEIQERDNRESSRDFKRDSHFEERSERGNRPDKSKFFDNARPSQGSKPFIESFFKEEAQSKRSERSFDTERPRGNGRREFGRESNRDFSKNFRTDSRNEGRSENRFERSSGGFKKKFSSGSGGFRRDERQEKRSDSFNDRPSYGEKREAGDRPAFAGKREFRGKPAFSGKREFNGKPAFAGKSAFRDRPPRRENKDESSSFAGGESSPKRKSDRRPFSKKVDAPADL